MGFGKWNWTEINRYQWRLTKIEINRFNQINYAFIPEFERCLVTRYRTCSQNFKIESGWLCNPMILHVCIQSSIYSTFFDRLLLEDVHTNFTYTTSEEALTSPDAAKILIEMEKVMKKWFILFDVLFPLKWNRFECWTPDFFSFLLYYCNYLQTCNVASWLFSGQFTNIMKGWFFLKPQNVKGRFVSKPWWMKRRFSPHHKETTIVTSVCNLRDGDLPHFPCFSRSIVSFPLTHKDNTAKRRKD